MAGHNSGIAGQGKWATTPSPQEKTAETAWRAAETLPPAKLGLA